MASASRVACGPDSSRGEVSACAVHALQGHDVAGAGDVQGDRGGRRDRPLEGRRRALAAVGVGRVSSSTVQRLSQGCSSRRTISSPRRAVERQCTRRRSSPWRYSRVATSSSPAEATDRVRLSPLPAHSPPSGVDGSGTTTGVTSEGVAWR